MKWEQFARRQVWTQILLYLIFLGCWTVTALAAAIRGDDYSGQIWRIVFEVEAIMLLVYFVFVEISEVYGTYTRHSKWKAEKLRELEAEVQDVNPLWSDSQ